ncbi:MAG: exo-alpha-sialidase [Chloroflexi bacterium]|nr:exo-alpha-sialidase [Chloroflexota bacterium]
MTTDGAGNWLAVWSSTENLGGAIGTDSDILTARSTDNGATWTAPAALNSNAAADTGDDFSPQVTTDGAGNWLAVWYSDENLGGAIGTDHDILYAVASPPTPTPTLSPSPSPTSTPSPTPSPTSSPTPTPSATATAGQQVTWADNNCKDGVNPIDSLFVLRGDAGLPTDTGDCPDMGADIEVLNASPHIWGDVDCKDGMTPVDSLKILRYDAGLSVSQADGCPEMGSQVIVTD